MFNPLRLFTKKQEMSHKQYIVLLQQRWHEADRVARLAREELNAARKLNRLNNIEMAQLEVRQADSTLRARKAKATLLEAQAKNASRQVSRGQRKDAVRKTVHGEKNRWHALGKAYLAAHAEKRRQIEENAAHASGTGVIRKIRALALRASGYTTLGISYLVRGVGVVIEGTFGTLGDGGSWLLERISGVLPKAWSGLWEAAIRTVRVVLAGALFLITSFVEGLLVILSGVAMAVVWPFARARRLVIRRRAVVVVSTPAPGTVAAPPLTPVTV